MDVYDALTSDWTPYAVLYATMKVGMLLQRHQRFVRGEIDCLAFRIQGVLTGVMEVFVGQFLSEDSEIEKVKEARCC